MFTKGNEKISGEKARLFSAANKSDEITETSLPEFVAIRDFIESFVTFLKITATRVLRIRIEVRKPQLM